MSTLISHIINPADVEAYALAGVLIALVVCLLALVIARILRNPFRYPYFELDFDVSGKRNVHIDNLVDEWLCTPGTWNQALDHHRQVEAWKKSSAAKAEGSLGPLAKRRRRQLAETIDDEREFCFITVRDQTRYHQRNYQRTPYKVSVPDRKLDVDLAWLQERRDALSAIGFETTLRKYYAKNQRRLMTPALRQQIAERDNYTCQICGKYMPDGVGLHIDHIVPVSKGGKTVPSNLQVLCSKCNGSKSNR
ncbi:HNH endonuclease [Parolsenella catena]|uniref:HNH endonuclease n=1 Tax=Parolsenella catena TaxID=2003188 RepID=UPI002E77B7F2|nr:HNH endonuclease [Parolsenella catena]